MRELDANRLIVLFNDLFMESESTVLQGGADEPVYFPVDSSNAQARVVFTQDYFCSALHEVAHWCLAGSARRQQQDYGYWYVSNRSAEQQRAFEQAEIKPQALEWVFSLVAGIAFQPSLDYLQHPNYKGEQFRTELRSQFDAYLVQGLPVRAELFQQSLLDHIPRSSAAIRKQASANG